jgi:hypothetical protein
MSERAIDLDALFDRDADGRLLDRRRHEELGLPPPARSVATTPPSFGAESMVEETQRGEQREALLRVALEARPDRGLIPGALVTVVVALTNDGDIDIPEARLRVAIPPEADPLAGSFVRDDLALDGDALLGEGLRLGAIGAREVARIRFALRVLPGIEPLDVAAHATAPGIPVVAAPALLLARRERHAAFETPRPFYELEAGETDDELEAGAPNVDTVIDEPAAPPLVVEEPEPEPEPELASEAEPEAAPQAIDGIVTLSAPLGPNEVRALERVFAGGVPHGLAALALLAGVGCTGGALGAALGLEAFRASVAAALPRALVAARMRKPTPPVVTREALAALRADAEISGASSERNGPALVLRLDAREREALRAVLARDLDDPFLRGVQVLLAIAPRSVDGPSRGADAAVEALAAYRRIAGMWLMRVTVRRAVDRRYDPLVADDPALHQAGRTLVAALREAVA